VWSSARGKSPGCRTSRRHPAPPPAHHCPCGQLPLRAAASRRAVTCPVSTGGRTRRVQLVRGEGVVWGGAQWGSAVARLLRRAQGKRATQNNAPSRAPPSSPAAPSGAGVGTLCRRTERSLALCCRRAPARRGLGRTLPRPAGGDSFAPLPSTALRCVAGTGGPDADVALASRPAHEDRRLAGPALSR